MSTDTSSTPSRQISPPQFNGSKWAHLRTLPEFYTLIIGWIALFCLAGFYASMILRDMPEKANHIWKIIGFHIVGGAAIGTIKGSAYGDLTLLDNILINGLLTIVIIFLFTAVFSLSCRGLFHAPWLKKTFSDLKSGARSQKKTWVKFGIPGIFAFVIFPMTGTGPIIGSLLGRLIGLGYWTNLITVSSASLSTIGLAAYFGDKLSELVGDKLLSRIVLGIILAIILTAGLGKLCTLIKNRGQCRYNSKAEPIQREDTDDLDFVYDRNATGRSAAPPPDDGNSLPDGQDHRNP